MRLWRKKSGPPEPAAASPAAAGVRYGSEKERLKGDVQEIARQRIVVASALFMVMFTAVARQRKLPARALRGPGWGTSLDRRREVRQ